MPPPPRRTRKNRFKIRSPKIIELTPTAANVLAPAAKPLILVPFRDNPQQQRANQLRTFIDHYSRFFTNPDFRSQSWTVLIVEQSNDGRKFNRGALLNVGAQIAKATNHDAIFLHDVDLIADDSMIPYYRMRPIHPVHQGYSWQEKYDYDRFFGGVMSISVNDFFRINGYPRSFFGHGGEDDALRNRIAAVGIPVFRPTIRGGIKEMAHIATNEVPAWTNNRRWEDISADDPTHDGVKETKWTAQSPAVVLAPQIAKLTVVLNVPMGTEEKESIRYRVLHSSDEAMTYLTTTGLLDTGPSQPLPPVQTIVPILPVNDTTFAMTTDAARRTMQYIFDHLHTKAYLLVIKNNKLADWVTLQGRAGITASFLPYLKRLNRSLHWPFKVQRKGGAPIYIDDNTFTSNASSLQLMGCILSPIDRDRNDEPYTNSTNILYLRMITATIESFPLPDGCYIVSQTDALLLRTDRCEPWLDLVGGARVPLPASFRNGPFLPILNSSTAVGYSDIPLPTPDDWERIQDLSANVPKLDRKSLIVDWSLKRPTAVFRGTGTGCGYDIASNARIAIAAISQRAARDPRYNGTIDRGYPYLDAGIVNTAAKLKIHATEGIGYFDKRKVGVEFSPFMTKIEQSRHKYIVQIDGNVAAYRLASDMLMGSVILLVDSDSRLWFQGLMKPFVHYIPIATDLSNILTVIAWCREHDEDCRRIAATGKMLAESVLQRNILLGYVSDILSTVRAACHTN